MLLQQGKDSKAKKKIKNKAKGGKIKRNQLLPKILEYASSTSPASSSSATITI